MTEQKIILQMHLLRSSGFLFIYYRNQRNAKK